MSSTEDTIVTITIKEVKGGFMLEGFVGDKSAQAVASTASRIPNAVKAMVKDLMS